MIDLKELEERVILAAVSTSETDMAERSLDELKELADTAGAKTVGRVIQNRESVHPGTYLGKGKLQELREICLLYTSPSPRDLSTSRMPSSA